MSMGAGDQLDYYEVNFDGLVGPLHNYAGLSPGNVASELNRDKPSSPKKAALQGLDKMRFVSDLGIAQAFLPPHRRPAWKVLRQLGFAGNNEEVLAKAAKEAPHILAAACSASAMWTANAATVVPSHDSLHNRLYLVPANLSSNFHRSIEPEVTTKNLADIFSNENVLSALPATPHFYDEGAANHTRLCPSHGSKGLHLFVYGVDSYKGSSDAPSRYPARQTKASCEALVRKLGIPSEQVLLLQQSAKAIDAGVFHNDVISTGNNNVFLYHEDAFADPEAIDQIASLYLQLFGDPLEAICVSAKEVSLGRAVSSYLFNSQLLTLPSGEMILLAPKECETTKSVNDFIQNRLLEGDSSISRVEYIDLRESMCNGGGPACLRLRVVMNQQEMSNIHRGVLFTSEKEMQLREWIESHYPETIVPSDLADIAVHEKAKRAFDALENIIGLKLPEA